MTKRILGLGLAFMSLLWLALLSGCGSGCGDIDDEVFIQKALEHFIANQRETSAYSSDDGLIMRSNEVYTSVQEFRGENPDCCSFGFRGLEGFLPERWARFNTGYAGTAIIRYDARVVYENGIRRESRVEEIFLDSCAETIMPSKLWP